MLRSLDSSSWRKEVMRGLSEGKQRELDRLGVCILTE